MKTFGNAHLLVAYYNVASDPAAGAIGTVNLGIVLPPKSAVYLSTIIMRTTLTSATNVATLSLGTLQIGVNPPAALPQSIMQNLEINNYTLNVSSQGPNSGVFDFDNNGRYVTMTIGVEKLTGGSLTAQIFYFTTNV